MSTQDRNTYGDILCQAVDTIVTQRLSALEYDQTILCSIVDDSRREQGIYRVTNGSTVFEAVSDQTNYRNDNNVYVLIPRGNWNETKTITGKKIVKEQEKSYNYKNPFDFLVDVTGNMISAPIGNNIGLVANSPDDQDGDLDGYNTITLWTYNLPEGEGINESGENLSGYTRLGLQAQFQSWLNPFYIINTNEETEERISQETRIVEGQYGIRLKITTLGDKTIEQEDDQIKAYYLYIDTSDMNGNPYEFSTYFQQEKVFDISQFDQIVSMKLEFYEKPGTFKNNLGNQLVYENDLFGGQVAPNLFVKDPRISLGYDSREFENDDAILYSLDNTTYTSDVSDEKNTKKIKLRWIHDFGDNNLQVVTNKDKENLKYEIKWYRYKFGAPSVDKYSGVYWEYIDPVEGDEFECSFKPDVAIAEEKIKAIILYNGHSIASNIMVFTNEKEVINQATIDVVSAVSINCEDGTYGNYHIYKLDNSLIDQKDGPELRNFKIYFNISKLTEDEKVNSELTEAEKIEWIIPKKNSMIILNDDYITANGGQDIGDDNNYHIVRNIAIDENSGEYQVGEANIQQYRIRGYYSQNYSNNTITCIITKNRIQYIGTKELTFGPAGTAGTDCTFVLDFDNGITALTIGNPVATTVTARLYDHENKEVDLSKYSIKWDILNENKITCDVIKPPYQVELQVDDDPSMTSNYSILQAKLTNFGDFELIAYLPLPIRSDTNYKYIGGTTSLVYNSSGYLDNFYWNPYILYYTQGADSNILESYSDWGISVQNSNYGPKLDKYTDKDKNKTCKRLKPTSIYVDGGTNTGVCIYCTLNNTVVWSQPILITQNHYPAAILNKWNGELSLGGKDGNTIMSARVVAGSKDDYNRFSGVMMGDWSGKDATTDITSNTGIYGFYQGSASFGFRDDGTAFIGKVGEGRIEFNGTRAQITTNRYADDHGGMLLDFDDGKIEIKSPNTDIKAEITGDITIDSTQSKTPFKIGNNFSVNWDGTIKATDGNFSGVINADEGYIGGWEISENNISGGSTTLHSDGRIEAGGGNFSVSASGQLTAKGADITGTIDATTGYLGNLTVTGKLTSSSGSLDFGDGFKVSETGVLSAEGAIISGTITAEKGSIGGWAIGESTLTGGSVTLDSTNGIKAPSITVIGKTIDGETIDIGTLGSYQGSDGTNNTTVIGIDSSSNSVVLQSEKHVRLSAKSGINLESGGEIVCKGIQFSMGDMTSLVLPETVKSKVDKSLFTISDNTIAFSCTTTGIYATLK